MTHVDELNETSAQHTVHAQGKTTVASDPPERQSVDVKPMRYVLGISLAVAVLAMLAVFLYFSG